MLKLRKVAVTGGLSCGKSTVCHFLKKFGAYVVNSDDIVHRLLTHETSLGQRVIQLIGNDIIINNQINRSIIAQKVFNNPPLLRSLEQIMHPAVQKEIERYYEQANQQNNGKLFVAEVPLLYEAGMETFFDDVITVIADHEKSKQRFQKTKENGNEEYEKRSSQQMPTNEKAKRADYIITNNGSLQELEAETKKLMSILTKKPNTI